MCEGEEVIVPDLFVHELANVCWKYHHAHMLSADKAAELFATPLSLVDRVHDSCNSAVEVLNESMRLDHPACDVFYLVLARRNGATLMTLDEKLNELADQLGASRCLELNAVDAG